MIGLLAKDLAETHDLSQCPFLISYQRSLRFSIARQLWRKSWSVHSVVDTDIYSPKRQCNRGVDDHHSLHTGSKCQTEAIGTGGDATPFISLSLAAGQRPTSDLPYCATNAKSRCGHEDGSLLVLVVFLSI